DADFRWVTDVGLTGPDAGKGGKYLFVPPGYTGGLPSDGYFIAKPRTNTLLVFYRAFVKAGDIAGAVRDVKANAAVYPLHATTETGEPPTTTFVNTSGLKFNTISANTFRFYEELNGVVQNEPADFVDADTVGLFAAIGIKKGKPFAPDARMKAILTDAVAVANGFARTNLFASRGERAKIYTDRQWFTPFVGGSICSWMARNACWMPAICFSTTPPASPLPCRWRGWDQDQPMRWRCRMRRATTLTAVRRTRSRCQHRSPQKSSGLSWSTTMRRALCWRRTRSWPVSIVPRRGSRKIRTGR